jgi:hypothetical protein
MALRARLGPSGGLLKAQRRRGTAGSLGGRRTYLRFTPGGVVPDPLRGERKTLRRRSAPSPWRSWQALKRRTDVATPTEKAQKGGREKALGRAMRALEGLWRALEIPGPPPLKMAEFLIRRRKSVVEVRPYHEKQAEVAMFFPLEILRFPTPLSTFPKVRLMNSASGDVEVEVGGIYAREGKVFFSGRHLEKVTKNREAVKALRPLFVSLGLGDLEGTLEVLSSLSEGEARREGEYLLARQRGTGGRFILRRGSLLGDFALDKAFVLGEKVELFFPKDVELTLEGGGFRASLVHLVGLEVRWEGEKIGFGAGSKWVKARANGDDPVGELVRKRVARGLRELNSPPSPRMRALLEALARQKRPLQALKKEGFLRKVLLDALSRV